MLLVQTFKKLRKAYTLYELVMYMTLIGMVLYPMAPMINYSVKQLKDNEVQYDPNFYNFVEDIKYDNVLSEAITHTLDSEVTFTRLDKCKIQYIYNNINQTLERKILDSTNILCETGLRTYKLKNIKNFKLDTGILTINTVEYDTKTIEIKFGSNLNNYSFRYIIYDKN